MTRISRFVLFLLTTVGLHTRVLQAQQFMLPPPSRQVTQMPIVTPFSGQPTDEQQMLIWLSGNGIPLSYDGQRFLNFDASKPDRYRLFQRHPQSRLWIIRERANKPKELLYADSTTRQLVNLPDTLQLVRVYLRSQGIEDLYLGRQGKLWIRLSDQRLLGVNPRTLAVEQVLELESSTVLEEAPDGRLWFGTPTGLNVIDPRTGQRWRYDYDPEKTAHLSSGKIITKIRVRDNGDVLLGLINEIHILTPRTGVIRKIKLPLPTATAQLWTAAFIPDRYGNDYFSVGLMVCRITTKGQLERINFAYPAEKIIAVYIPQDKEGLSDRMWVRVVTNRLDLYDLKKLKSISSFNVLDVIINGNRLIENEETQDTRFQRDSTGYPTIRIKEGDFVQIRFSPFAEYRQVLFRYKLEGYSSQWTTYFDLFGIGTYQLEAGTYQFLLNWETPSGWQKQPASLRIDVQPVIWKTAWFRTIVLLIVTGIGYWLTRSIIRRRKLRQELARREFEAATLRQMDELKSQFFANVTHEFRTPLTIILNATEQLADESLASKRATDRLGAIRYNAHQLLRLINETLDMAKLDAGKLDRRELLGEPLTFIQQMVNQFQGLAQQKHIRLECHRQLNSELYLFDQEKLEKIVYNLLSNAVKFTPSDGSIRVESLVTAEKRLVIQVADTGIGIPANQLERVFDRFHQVDLSSTRAYSGTGIGLALVKELTEWLGGCVTVDSTAGKGSLFTVEIPLNTYQSTESISQQGEPIELTFSKEVHNDGKAIATSEVATLPKNGSNSQNENRRLVLVVEDNADLRQYVVDYLANTYRIIVAENGRLGFEMAQEKVPDLIISDVMMPEMDGYTLVERLKADDCTSHIPVILLTAKSSYDSRLKGLGIGADDYIGKPFNLEELALRIGNCLKTRENWQRWLANRTESVDLPKEDTPLLDKEDRFLARIRQAVLDHLENQALDVDWLATQANMSRTQLNRKLSALTALSPNRFIHRVRLEKAAELLQTGDLNVTQVAYAVGYSSPSHFSKVFREHFGYLPAELRV
ncbi:response regulator [Spirosoma sp. BT702]|uniref:histidine kinase n=1 Tax=Spirosoma profusum TaxID=2771354 RepID=A0A926Y0R8_9BACT|nr:ATP-binding protein [Spirosoma profusum]MBD2701807.1 response regulator [Spirosoma profusum]